MGILRPKGIFDYERAFDSSNYRLRLRPISQALWPTEVYDISALGGQKRHFHLLLSFFPVRSEGKSWRLLSKKITAFEYAEFPVFIRLSVEIN
jgi:hypothetical protein